jgi:Skp family chaperone for outer membrane proteins
MKRMLVVVAVVGMLMVAVSAFAQAPAAPALSAEQITKIQKIQADRIAETGKLKTEMSSKQLELQGLFREANLDRGKIEAKQKELAALQAQMVEKDHAYRLTMAEVLTPEQRAQLPAFGGRMPFKGPRGGKGGTGFRW